MSEKKDVKAGIVQAIDILKTERDCIQHVIDLLESNAEVSKVDVGQPADKSRRAKEQKPRKSPTANLKRSYIPTHEQIRTILEQVDEPKTPFTIRRFLLEQFNVSVTETALKKIFKSDAGRTFCEPEDGLWGLVE